MEKHAFQINLPVPAIIGSITGAGIANKQMQKNLQQQQIKNDNTTVLSGDYYSQVGNIANGMKVVFTPYSVVYTIRNGAKEISIDTIPTEAMNKDMYIAWQERNAQYFKNLLLNKMQSEIQFAEQQFAQNIIDRHLDLAKQASYDMVPFELYGFSNNIHDFYEKEDNEKIASAVFSDLNDQHVPIDVTLGITGKHIGDAFSDILAQPLEFLKMGDKDTIKKVQTQMLTPGYVKSRGKVGFMPDRVVFVVDNMVVTSLLVFDMDEDTFKAFKNKDSNYFMTLFTKEAKIGAKRMDAKLVGEKKKMNKEAAFLKIDIIDIFYNNDVHPFIYLKVLTHKYKESWFHFEPTVLIKSIEKDFNLIDPIEDIPMNKILAVQAANSTTVPFTNPHTFEKLMRSFNNLPINWMASEPDDMSAQEYAFGLDIFDIVTPIDDTYDNFSDEVYMYLVKSLAEKNVKAFLPSENFTKSDLFKSFYSLLNESLINENNRLDVDSVFDLKKRADIVQNNQQIFTAVQNILYNIINDKIEVTSATLQESVEKNNIPKELETIVKRQIIDNLETDIFLRRQQDILESQLAIYGLE